MFPDTSGHSSRRSTWEEDLRGRSISSDLDLFIRRRCRDGRRSSEVSGGTAATGGIEPTDTSHLVSLRIMEGERLFFFVLETIRAEHTPPRDDEQNPCPPLLRSPSVSQLRAIPALLRRRRRLADRRQGPPGRRGQSSAGDARAVAAV